MVSAGPSLSCGNCWARSGSPIGVVQCTQRPLPAASWVYDLIGWGRASEPGAAESGPLDALAPTLHALAGHGLGDPEELRTKAASDAGVRRTPACTAAVLVSVTETPGGLLSGGLLRATTVRQGPGQVQGTGRRPAPLRRPDPGLAPWRDLGGHAASRSECTLKQRDRPARTSPASSDGCTAVGASLPYADHNLPVAPTSGPESGHAHRPVQKRCPPPPAQRIP